MSKKDKSKFKKLIKAQLSQEISQAQKNNPSANPVAIASIKPNTINSATVSNASTATAAVEITNSEINLVQIKHDLKKTGLVVGGLAIIMGLIYYFDLKYNILLIFGDWFFKVLNIK